MPAAPELVAIVTARNEGEGLASTLAALGRTFPGAALVVADDASEDDSAAVARATGARVVSASRRLGKGGAATLAAESVLARAWEPDPPVFLLCDGDLGETAAALGPLVERVRGGDCDLAVAAFERRVGGGVGAALGFARWAIRRRCGLTLRAPISGQRALRGEVLRVVVPFAPRFGMEIGMTVDAARAGFRVCEVELPLAHRATGRTLRGFLHRARQLRDFALVYADRR